MTWYRFIVIMLITCFGIQLLSGCEGNYIESPPLPLTEAAKNSVENDLDSFLSQAEGKRFEFCRAEPGSTTCKTKRKGGLAGGGLGGLYIPLYLEVKGFKVLKVEKADETQRLKVKFDTRVDGIPPFCLRSTADATINSAGSANVIFDPFYCNWLVIGNVISRFKFSINDIDPQSNRFSGYYSVIFNGTGNAGGSGYFLAYPKAKQKAS